MSCDLTKGRLELCKDSIGGIKKVFFINEGDATITEGADDVITDLGTLSVYEYDTKDSSSLVETINSSRENGTTFWEQVLNLVVKKQDAVTRKELKLMAYGRPKIVIMDNNNNLLLIGKENGVDVTGGTFATGTALGDLSGYTITLTGREAEPACFLTPGVDPTQADYPFDGMGAGVVTIVKGTDPPA